MSSDPTDEAQATPITLLYRPLSRIRARLRRALDLTIALVLLLFALPVLAIAAIAAMIEDPGAPMYRQRRVGRFGRPFTIYKLRTMYRAACGDNLSPTVAQDSRITRVGRLLRRTSIDELPQLWNVVRGEMTLVGPRPEMPFVVAGYEPWQHLRHLVSPGITGLWQTTCRSRIALHRPEATLLDLQYIESSSELLDARILLNTVRAVVSASGAY